MDPWAPAQPPQLRERQLLRSGPPPWPSSWDRGHLPGHSWEEGHQPRREALRPASRVEYYESGYPNRPYSRQGYEDAYWQYPAASHGGDYAYQSHQWHPVAWKDDRDLRQGEPYRKSTNYWKQHYYRGYHPNLAVPRLGHDRTQAYNSYEESYISVAQREWAEGESFCSNLGDPSSQPQEPSGQPSLLLQYRETGLSSSSYELSQYIRDGADHYDPVLSGTWSPAEAGGPLASTLAPEVPLKFLLPHVAVCFGARGQLVLVCPHRPAEGQLAHVELHSLEDNSAHLAEVLQYRGYIHPLSVPQRFSLLFCFPKEADAISAGISFLDLDTGVQAVLHDMKELEELQAFPGPLAREDLHKVDVMTFCQQKIATSCDPSTQRGRDSALLWKFLVLLCQQNGSMVGSDTAELLMQDCRCREKYKKQIPATNLNSLTDDEWVSYQPGTLDLITGEVPPIVETQAQIVEKFTKLLYYGRKKDALVWAMRNQLWGHALFLSSKMDPRTYSWVLTGFTSTLATNDPLQTLFQLMSGRIPQAALSCGNATWGDWRPHLAVMLSNKVGDMELNHRAIVTMGDTLAGRGAVEAAHFCYLLADIPFGYFGAKADRMALLGSSHRQAFTQFARTEVIQRMEIFEYCQQLRQPESFLLPFQAYKLLYASRLADYGLPAQALQYCEQIATVLLAQDPASHPVLAQQVMKLAERLKLSDPLLLEMPEQDQMLEPDWLVQLQACCREWEVEDDLLPEVALGQPGLSLAAASMADGHELAQSEGYQCDEWYQPMPPQAPSSHEDVSVGPPAPTQVAALPLLGVGQEPQPPTLGPGMAAHLGGGFAEPPPQAVLLAGEDGEIQGTSLSPVGVQQSLPAQQGELKARARTVSESSTVSLEDDSQPSSDSTSEDTAEELSPSEAVKPGEDKSFGFWWFGWFRSKPTKETSSKAVSERPPDSPTLGPQERMSPSPPDTPLTAGTSPLAQPPSRDPGGMQGAVTPVSIEMKGSWDTDSGKSAGEQTSSHETPSPVGTVPLFNPIQFSQLAATARPNQPRLLSQRRYPNPL